MTSQVGRIETRAVAGFSASCSRRLSSSQYMSRLWKTPVLRSRHENRKERSSRSYTEFSGPVSLFGFGSKGATTEAVNYICIDCGYIYTGADFSKEPNSYACPACRSPKRRFKKYKGTDVGKRPNNSNNACLKRLKEQKW